VDFNLEFDMAAIKSFADVINTKFNTSGFFSFFFLVLSETGSVRVWVRDFVCCVCVCVSVSVSVSVCLSVSVSVWCVSVCVCLCVRARV
jgi:hypothetical protein